jgi:hypothetical protein
MLNIDGILTGTIVTDLTLAQQTMWFRLLGVAGKGHGRIGYVERAQGVGFSQEALLMELRCYTDEERDVAKGMLAVCTNGAEPRIIVHNDNVIEIIKWDKYQYIKKGVVGTNEVGQKKDKHAGMRTE